MAVGVGASFASTLASQRLIRLVERDRALWPYAAYRAVLAACGSCKAASMSRPTDNQETRQLEPRQLADLQSRAAMSDAYARAGVDQGAADSAVAGLIRALATIRLDRPSSPGAAARATTRA